MPHELKWHPEVGFKAGSDTYMKDILLKCVDIIKYEINNERYGSKQAEMAQNILTMAMKHCKEMKLLEE